MHTCVRAWLLTRKMRCNTLYATEIQYPAGTAPTGAFGQVGSAVTESWLERISLTSLGIGRFAPWQEAWQLAKIRRALSASCRKCRTGDIRMKQGTAGRDATSLWQPLPNLTMAFAPPSRVMVTVTPGESGEAHECQVARNCGVSRDDFLKPCSPVPCGPSPSDRTRPSQAVLPPCFPLQRTCQHIKARRTTVTTQRLTTVRARRQARRSGAVHETHAF